MCKGSQHEPITDAFTALDRKRTTPVVLKVALLLNHDISQQCLNIMAVH